MTDDDPRGDGPADRPGDPDDRSGGRDDRPDGPADRPDSPGDGHGDSDDRPGDPPGPGAGPGRRAPAATGEAVAGVPVLRRAPADTDALVRVDSREATAWCPFEGTADYYSLSVEYWPDEHVLELMSYRDYLQTYRDEELGHEAFAARVYDDLLALLDPRWLRLTVEAPPRYGLEMSIRHQTAPRPAALQDDAPATAHDADPS